MRVLGRILQSPGSQTGVQIHWQLLKISAITAAFSTGLCAMLRLHSEITDGKMLFILGQS